MQLYKIETLVQVFAYELWETSKTRLGDCFSQPLNSSNNISLTEHLYSLTGYRTKIETVVSNKDTTQVPPHLLLEVTVHWDCRE